MQGKKGTGTSGTYEGKPCKHGHGTTRYKGGGSCVICSKNKSKARASTPEGREKKRLAYWKDGGKEDRRARNLKANYDLTIEQYNEKLVSQVFGCDICGGEPGGKHERFHVDHCHKTQKIRGLLCAGCNVGLGSFNDNPVKLLAAIEYLRKHGRH